MAAGLDLICGTQQQSTQEKRTGKRKTELDAQTSLLERGIEFLHNHHFCCPLRMTETERGQNQEDLWALRGSRRFFGYVSWQNLKSIICLANTHENNHHSAVTNELLGQSASHFRLNCAHSFTGWKVPKTSVWVPADLPMRGALLVEEESHQDIVDTQRDLTDAVTLLIAGQTLSTWCCKVGGSCGVYFWFRVADWEISKHCYGKLNTCWKTQAQYNHQKEDKMSFCSELPLGACCFTGSLRWSEHFSAMVPGLHICVQLLMKRAWFLANARACCCLKAEALVEPDHRGSQSKNAFSQPKPRPAWQQWTLTRCHVHRTLPMAGGAAWQAEVAPEDLCLCRGQQREEHHKKWQAVLSWRCRHRGIRVRRRLLLRSPLEDTLHHCLGNKHGLQNWRKTLSFLGVQKITCDVLRLGKKAW